MKYFVGVDEGTSSCRAIVFDEKGNRIALASREYPCYYSKPGYVEQDILEITDAIVYCVKKAIIDSEVNPSDIVGISHSNQGITMVLLDENNKVVRRRTIGWQDMRYTEVLDEVKSKISDEEYYQIGGMSCGTYNISTLNWLQKNEPLLWKRVKRICCHQDYFLYFYGANGFFIDEGNANFLSMVNLKTGEWDERLMNVYNIDVSFLSKIVHKPGTFVGNVSEEFSKLTGLPTSCRVCLGQLDTNCSSLGAGATEDGTEVMIVGTAGVSILVTDKNVSDPNKRVTFRSNPGFGNNQLYIMTNTAASSFRWFRDEMCTMEVTTSKLVGIDPYDLMTQTAAHSKPGANGVIALTCLQGAHGRIKNEKAKGLFYGITLGTKKADLAEAILEGICFEMYDLVQLQKSLGANLKKIRLCGGVAKSDRWCQMFADIFAIPVELTKENELGALGAAICAGVGSNVFSSLSEATKNVVLIDKVYLPNLDKNKIYLEAYRKWKAMYQLSNEHIFSTF